MNTFQDELVGKMVLYKVPAHCQDLRLHSNGVKEGDVLPAIVVRQWSTTTVNLRVFCDNREDAWITSATMGDKPGQWQVKFDGE